MQSLISQQAAPSSFDPKTMRVRIAAHRLRELCRWMVAVVGLIAVNGVTHAAVFCATTSTELQTALDSAKNNGEADTIKIARGIYKPASANGFTFYSNEPHSLAIRGGYRYAQGNPCYLPFNSSELTVVDGEGTKALLRISPGSTADISITSMTFRNGTNGGIGAPIDLGGTVGYVGKISLERIAVRDNVSGLSIQAYNEGSISVRNSLFVGNMVNDAWVPMANFSTGGTDGSGSLEFVGNTVSGNGVILAGKFAPVQLSAQSGAINAYNNVLCGNTGDDLHIFVNISVAITLAHNDICSMDTSTVNLIQIANLNMDPGFVGNGDYRLRGDSPLRDAGDNNPPGGTGSVDVGGRARVVFGTVDIGAHELQDSIFSDGFD